MVKQYEDGCKQKTAWHKQQNDPQPLYVWETLTGNGTGTYVVGRLNQRWADFDKPPLSHQADIDEYNKVLASYVESMTTAYYVLMSKVSNMASSKPTDKFAKIVPSYTALRPFSGLEINPIDAKASSKLISFSA